MKEKIKHLNRSLQIYLAYNRRKVENNPLPIRLWIEPTNVCNLSCIMCLNKSIPKNEKGFMDFNLFKRIIDEAADFIHDVYLHHRGESLLHSNIFEMIKYAKMKNIFTRLHTNATLLTEEKSYLLLNSGLDFLSFSFDGYEKKIYENIRRGADFNETLDNILRFLTIKKKLHKDSPYATFTVIEFPNGSPGEMRKDIKKQFIKKFDSLPLNQFVTRAPHNWAGGYNSKNKISDKSFLPCTFPWYSLTVFWDGRVVPCPQDFFGKLTLGNVKDSSLLDIWNGPEEILLREKLSRRDYEDIVPCNKCDRLWRRKLFGVPMVELGRFLKDNLIGYNRSIRKILR